MEQINTFNLTCIWPPLEVDEKETLMVSVSDESETVIDVKYYYGFEDLNISVTGTYLDSDKTELELPPPEAIASYTVEHNDIEGF